MIATMNSTLNLRYTGQIDKCELHFTKNVCQHCLLFIRKCILK